MSRLWTTSSYWILTTFVAAFLFLGIVRETSEHISFKKKKEQYKFPDFNRIYHTRTLKEQQISLDTNDRIIIVGDIHGMNNSIHHLLTSLSYKPHNDILVFAGDLLAKSTLSGSLSFLEFLAQNHYSSLDGQQKQERIFAVRGNHDQFVVQWRTWRDWFTKLNIPLDSRSDRKHAVTNGQDFLNLIEAEWAVEKTREESDAEEWVSVIRKRAEGTWREEWWKRIPMPGTGKHKQEWRMFGDHYFLAREMSTEQASYLTSLPLILHIPSMHFFVVHAGLLPYDVRFPPSDSRQPLAHLPRLTSDLNTDPYAFIHSDTPSRQLRIMSRTEDTQQVASKDDRTLRELQEHSLLTDIPQNNDWWNVLNIRSVRKNGKVSKDGDIGKPWSKFWNGQMERCDGFDSVVSAGFEEEEGEDEDDEGGKEEDEDEDEEGDDDEEEDDDPETTYSLRCRPSTVVYGHSASRGLDIKRWTKGLDTGCLYGRKLTALVLSRSRRRFNDEESVTSPRRRRKGEKWQFGEREDGVQMKVHSVRCKAPDLEGKS
ncbi:hypothetical protein QCA50_000917 [Cerrena zonata]|uniref:Calcineurin-like phosphoesterase domain-containing protein n=1 Tax=Cerrena zonata TaxID=2478898 RepID=A0AAW0H0K9_9APHY